MKTATQAIKHALIIEHLRFNPEDAYSGDITTETIDDAYQEVLVERDYQWDAESEFRGSGVKTDIPCDFSRHYESESVAALLPGGVWVGWTYWFGGGKHGDPESIDWMSGAYFLDCVEEEKITTVRTFTKKE